MVLENKLGLTNSADLAREEERISKKKAIEMFETVFLINQMPESLTHYQKSINIYLKIFTTLQEKYEQKILPKAILDLLLLCT